jgi:hypothetical protein
MRSHGTDRRLLSACGLPEFVPQRLEVRVIQSQRPSLAFLEIFKRSRKRPSLHYDCEDSPAGMA